MSPSTPAAESAARAWLTPAQALAIRPLQGQAAEAAAPDARGSSRYGFRIGELALLLGEKVTAETIEAPVIHPMPNTADWFLGLINLRGSLVPVFDLHLLLRQTGADAGSRARLSILIIDRGERAVGVRIDGLPASVALGTALAQAAPPANELAPFVTQVYPGADSLWLDLDLDGFLRSLRKRI